MGRLLKESVCLGFYLGYKFKICVLAILVLEDSSADWKIHSTVISGAEVVPDYLTERIIFTIPFETFFF